jgi:Holliday junction resolvasome RuvABC endonuclease subunit
MEKDILLALDQASAVSGYAIFEDGKIIKHGTFSVDDEKIATRLVKIKKNVLDLISNFNVTRVALEDIQLQKNVETYKALAQVLGVLTETLEEIEMPYEIVYSSSWKSTLRIKGNKRRDQKRNAQKYVLDNFNIKATQDARDAICIGAHLLLPEEKCAWSN